MNILPHTLTTITDKLTSRVGILAIAKVMETLNLSELIDKAFPLPKGNGGFNPLTFIETLILMQYGGHFHLDAAGYQAKIIEYCDEKNINIQYAIRPER